MSKVYCIILILCEGQAELKFFRWLTDKIKECNPEKNARFVFHPVAETLAGKGHGALRRAMVQARSKFFDEKFILYDAGDKEAKCTAEIATEQHFKKMKSQLFFEDFLLDLSHYEGKKFPDSNVGNAPKKAFKERFGAEAHKIALDKHLPDFREVLTHDLLKEFYQFLKSKNFKF